MIADSEMVSEIPPRLRGGGRALARRVGLFCHASRCKVATKGVAAYPTRPLRATLPEDGEGLPLADSMTSAPNCWI